MNPIVISVGPIQMRAYTTFVALGGLAVAICVLAGARRVRPDKAASGWFIPWLDVLIAGLALGLVAARAGHVWLNWAYFAAHTDEIANFASGGLDWHGALVGGLLGAVGAAALHKLPIGVLLDALALGIPLLAAAAWRGCMDAACGYGLEVRTLADYPAWLVAELSDVYGDIAPRLNLPIVGILFSLSVFIIVVLFTASGRLRGVRLWPILILLGLGTALVSVFRAEYVPLWFGRRADQVLDLAVALGAALAWAMWVFGNAYLRRLATAPARRIDYPVKQ